ncbi:uncharacterized protein J3R85_011491 [Psidium guajava]|nr:uncharacterized protein J3R85_011491 [Psidium guajava]
MSSYSTAGATAKFGSKSHCVAKKAARLWTEGLHLRLLSLSRSTPTRNSSPVIPLSSSVLVNDVKGPARRASDADQFGS